MNKMNCDLPEMLNLLIDYENQIVSEKKKRNYHCGWQELQDERQRKICTKKEVYRT